MKRWRWLIGLGVLVIVGLVLWRVIIIATKPESATIKQPTTSSSQPAGYGTKSYVGKQVSFDCDERYSLNTGSNATPGLDSFVFNFSGKPFKHLAVAVDKLPVTGLSEYPSYQTRAYHPDMYKQTQQTVQGSNYAVFSATDGSQMTAFGTRGGQVVSVALTSGAGDSSLAGELSEILITLHWR